MRPQVHYQKIPGIIVNDNLITPVHFSDPLMFRRSFKFYISPT